MPRFRPRISLLTALLLMTILGMAIVIVQLWREVGPIRAKVRQLREETGQLSIEDVTKFHAIEVMTGNELNWKWRVWVPQGETAILHFQLSNVPRIGVPVPRDSQTLQPGEHWITLSLTRESERKQWISNFATKDTIETQFLRPDEYWFDWSDKTEASDGVINTTYVAKDNDKTVVLKRLRVDQVRNSPTIHKSDKPTAGFIIWLDRK
jgi:hypothetical protein